MKNNIFTILKQMFGGHNGVGKIPTEFKTSYETYVPNPNDIRIVAGDDVLIITDDKKIGGLWAGVDNYDPCSGSEQKCFSAMRDLINENIDEACDSLIFKLKEHLYLVNLADCNNRSAFNEMSLSYLHLCGDKIDVFYPIINRFVSEHSFNQKIGLIILPGGGTSIGLTHLRNKLRADGFTCFVEGNRLFFQETESGYYPSLFNNYEEFDATPYLEGTLKDFMDKNVHLLLQAMGDRVKERMLHPDINSVPTFPCPEYKKLSEYGYIRTIADIVKVLNDQNHYADPKALRADLQKTLAPYRERGTVSQSAIAVVDWLIHREWRTLFCGKELDVCEFARVIDDIPSEGNSPIDEVFSVRQKAKILYAVELANKICRYTNGSDLADDLHSLFYDNSTWFKKLDDVHPHMDYGIRFFLDNLSDAWAYITREDGLSVVTLDNDLLEKYLFTDHEKKILEIGLVQTIKEDYEVVTGCHSTRLLPKKPGAGPVYVLAGDDNYIKACHPSSDTLIQQKMYEHSFVSTLLGCMVKRNEYKRVDIGRDTYYIPIRDYSRPVFETAWAVIKEMEFEAEEEKLDFIRKWI